MTDYRRLALCFLALGIASGGCVELQSIVDGTGQGNTGDDGSASEDQNSTNPPVVRLSVSNPVPQVNEQVVLTCSIISGDFSGATFDFQPTSGRLIVDHSTGTGTFIIQESDIGAAFVFTCTATNEQGTSAPSNQQLIVPTQ